jgi:2-(1,2-epoxy-1,2-dihydrophenyl)acetyl-CoA isomerase
MPEQSYETIRTTAADGVLTITLNRPESLNALNAAMRRELTTAMKAASRDEATRCVLLTGEGRGFCSGADLRGGSGERQFRRILTDEYNPLIRAIRDLPKPVVAAVNGVAAGAGMSLALACDLVIAAEEAKFVVAFGRIGLVPDSGLTRTLVRALGRHGATQILFSAEPLTARGAADLGLVAAILPGEDLPGAAAELASRLAASPTRALGLTKRLVNNAEQAELAESLALEAALQELAGRTDDHAEGLTAFSEKRDPRFSGR